MNYCSLSRLITKHDNVLLQFTRARLITIYDNVLLQFTTDITIYDDCYHDLRQVLQFTTLLQFTTEQPALNVTPGKNTLLARQVRS